MVTHQDWLEEPLSKLRTVSRDHKGEANRDDR